MVAINLYLVLGLLQALLIIVVVLAILIWRLHRTRSRMQRAESELTHLRAHPTAVNYLESALQQAPGDSASASERTWIQIRGACLGFELARLRAAEQGETPALSELGRQLDALLQSQPATTAEQAAFEREPEVDDENIDFTELLGRQTQLLAALRVQVHSAIANTADLQQCDEKLKMLELVGRELKVCTEMTEEENNFLRDQIRALLDAS